MVNRLVLPKERRSKVLQIAHDSLGHLSVKKFKDHINQHFTWPFLARDCDDYYKSCDTCQVNKRGQNKTMCEQPIVTEPFEHVCIDLVGPLPKSKRGYRYLLTYVCLGTRWPEAVALKSIRAKDVAEGLLDIFSRTGVPLSM